MEKTDAIILNSVKYGDNKLIVNTFTRECGRMAFSVTLPSSRNKASALPYCQPLFQNEIEYNGAATSGAIRHAKNITPAFTYMTIPFSYAKTSVVMFLAEMLTKVLSYSEQNEELYDFLATSLQLLDNREYKGINFHIKFLMQLSKYMGFYPANRYTEQKPCFDLTKSKFTEKSLLPKHQIMPPYSLTFSQMLDSDFIECEQIELNGSSRSHLLEKTIEYYRYHFETLDNIKSLEVLQKVYH